jgi:hypothetical protein
MYSSRENATCTQEGASAPTPTKLTCEQCFTKFLKPDQINMAVHFLDETSARSLASLCTQFEKGFPNITEEVFRHVLVDEVEVEGSTVAKLIQCLKDFGIVFDT